MLAVHAATGPEMVEDLARVVAAEFADIVEKGPSAPELQRSKAQLKAGLLMALESSSVRAEQMARHLMAHDRFVSVAELMDKVNEVNAESVQVVGGSDTPDRAIDSARRLRSAVQKAGEGRSRRVGC